MKPRTTCLTTNAISRAPRRLQLARFVLPLPGSPATPPPRKPPSPPSRPHHARFLQIILSLAGWGRDSAPPTTGDFRPRLLGAPRFGSISFPSLSSPGTQWPFPRRVEQSSGAGARVAVRTSRTPHGKRAGHSSNFVTAPGASPAVLAPPLPARFHREFRAAAPGSLGAPGPRRAADSLTFPVCAPGAQLCDHQPPPSCSPGPPAHFDCVFSGRESRGGSGPMHNSGT